MKMLIRKTLLIALVAALGLASLPMFGVAAAGSQDPTPPPQDEMTDERLEKLWARQLRAYERFGKTDEFIAKVQQLIERAGQNGKDVAAVQAALDAFEDAVSDAKPIHQSMAAIVNSHAGFDANGKVTDSEQAKQTVQQMGEKLKGLRDAMAGTGKELHEALKAFRDANPRPEKTPTP
jgi:hypothetical protein